MEAKSCFEISQGAARLGVAQPRHDRAQPLHGGQIGRRRGTGVCLRALQAAGGFRCRVALLRANPSGGSKADAGGQSNCRLMPTRCRAGAVTFTRIRNSASTVTRPQGSSRQRLREFGVDEIHEGIAQTGHRRHHRGAGRGPCDRPARRPWTRCPLPRRPGRHALDQPRQDACLRPWTGHTTMLLGAAKYLAETRNFSGRVALIFQPAEENGRRRGGDVSPRGIMDRFGIDSVYALHNVPGLAEGQVPDHPRTDHGRGRQLRDSTSQASAGTAPCPTRRPTRSPPPSPWRRPCPPSCRATTTRWTIW